MPKNLTRSTARRRLTAQEAAEELGVTVRTVRNMIARGELRAYRLGGTTKGHGIRIEPADLDAALHPIPTTGGAA
ncbi:helix-turn-helix domain-containing protein [Flexivirga oryzae]|uniref:Excisionase family DNA binding protein n=1 Tax=Flexivirga oryzae TaxID=1794944 RepID=A0A839N5Z3_9MICO|nr:helix-turn-helix domain-containing protein [Flexivirga oryzae]MBB2892189.1 excisionase family DNA binding protein [Flexivirga oryzae]